MTKVCKACRIEKPLSAFPKNGKIEGVVQHRADCTECYNIRRKIDKKSVRKFVNNAKHRNGEIATLKVADWRDVMLYFRGGCAYCGAKQSRRVKLTKEHVVPVIKGGLTTRCNIIPACTPCNSSKSDDDLVVWFPKQPFYTPERMELIQQWVLT